MKLQPEFQAILLTVGLCALAMAVGDSIEEVHRVLTFVVLGNTIYLVLKS